MSRRAAGARRAVPTMARLGAGAGGFALSCLPLAPTLPSGLGEHPGVVFGHDGSDLERHPVDRGTFDFLSTRHHLGAGCFQELRDLCVVEAVARQTIEPVHDDVVDVLFPHKGQKPLQSCPISGVGALTDVDEFLDDLGL